jgi:hypothetical protein
MNARIVLRWLLRACLLCIAVLTCGIMVIIAIAPRDTHDLTVAYMHAGDAPGEASDREVAAAWRRDHFMVARYELGYAVIFGATLYGFLRLKSRCAPRNI